MSNRTHPRTEAKYKPTLNGLHYWKERNAERKTTVSESEIKEVRSVIPDSIGPKAIEREINKAIRHAF